MKKFPNIIPIFPLSGVIYFPKTNLPLNIFEQRYLDLVNDAYNKDKLMGMVQSKKADSAVYDIGCLGKISDYQKSKDGRVLINLTGISRFKIIKEVRNKKLYREFQVDYSEFEIDAKFKLNLIQDILASKEMYVGRHYIKKKKWIAAMNRFKIVLEDYNTTVFIEEALHRLVEINYKLGLVEESQKYAKILGYNYLSSEWYKKSYKVFNKNYEKRNIDNTKKEKKGVISKFKKLFE